MKGTVFQTPLELKLDVTGESWNQGDEIKGTLVIRNRGSEKFQTASVRLQSAYGQLKKVRAKSDDAFTDRSDDLLSGDGKKDLAPGEDLKLSWSHQLTPNCPVTDTAGSLFLLYGNPDAPNPEGQLQLIVNPNALIGEFCKAFETQHRFQTKDPKYKKGKVEISMIPPSDREYAAMEKLVALFELDGNDLNIEYTVSTKELDASAGSMALKKKKTKKSDAHSIPALTRPGGRYDYVPIERSIEELLSEFRK